MSDEVLIAGGGIGGLAAALGVAMVGRSARVFEQADAFQEFGAGLQLGPNAHRALEFLGIGSEIDTVASQPEEVQILDGVTGKQLSTITLGEEFRNIYGAPYRVIHRGDLLRLLVKACKRQKNIELNLSSPVKGLTVEKGVPALKAGGKLIKGAAIIGADGVRSTIRAETINDGGAVPTGHIIGRALIPGHIMPDTSPVVCLWMLPGGHVVHYPIRGGKDYNVVAAFDGNWQEDGWTAPASKAEIEERFEHCTGRLRDILAVVREWHKWAGTDRNPIKVWGDGPVTLIGDAAHGVLPYLAQGAAMSLEDACVLSRELKSAPDPTSAFRAYETERAPRVKRLRETSRNLGTMYHAGGPVRLARNIALRAMGETAARSRLDWIYNWQPEVRDV
jgi:2-polyprenyl-6-methoxyphenol hydroxylase-like FAD-dependent oxidoreductase